jgi:hypothetical protein
LSRIAFPYFIHKRREQQEKKVSEKEQNASLSVINSFDGDFNTLHVTGTSALRDWHFAISDLQKTTMIDGNIVTKASVAPWRLKATQTRMLALHAGTSRVFASAIPLFSQPAA